jgi:large subunit ribosomal protein L20
MPRATNAPASRKRRKRRLKMARGFRGGRSKLFRTATEAVDHAMANARISAAAREHGLSYSRFINGLSKTGIELNRKMVSEIAIHDPKGFEELVDRAKAAIS